MALKIFISSVSKEFHSERKALEDVIHRLQELFVGMEYFGSFSASPSDYDAQKVTESDVYVGLFGYEYGTIESQSNKSFTELEYMLAYERKIPCLIYFKDEIIPSENPNLSHSNVKLIELKTILRARHGVQAFSDENDIKIKFLIDFIQLVRSNLWHKANADQKGAISADALYSLTTSLIEEQIKIVGNDKYKPQLYIHRETIEKNIQDYVEFEKTYLNQLEKIFNHLKNIKEKFKIREDSENFLIGSQEVLQKANSLEGDRMIINKLKHMFFFDDVEYHINILTSLLQEENINKFIADLKRIVTNMRGLPFIDTGKWLTLEQDLLDYKRIAIARKTMRLDSSHFWEILQIFPSLQKRVIFSRKDSPLANDLIKELHNLVQLNYKRCIVLVDKAGAGKTNIVCNISQQLASKYPVILINGHITLSGEAGIESYIQYQLESLLGGNFTNWLSRISSDLEEKENWLFIIVDGINENSNLPQFAHLFSIFFPKVQNKRIKLILTCRDVLWDFFAPIIDPYNFREKPINLHDFTDGEWDNAVKVYLDYFEIKARFSKEAKDSFKNPLLLRFFCEAYKSQELGLVENLRLLLVFDLYVQRISERIYKLKNITRSDAIINLLVEVAYKMWISQNTTIGLETISLSAEDLNDNNSIYNLIRDENVVFEILIHPYSTKKQVRFVYDEFMEYILARSWIDKELAPTFSESAIEVLIEKAVNKFSTFPSAFGALLFLDGMLDKKGELINKTLIKIIDNENAFAISSQMATLYAFENMAINGIEDKIIGALDAFEKVAKPEIKERLVKVILKVLSEKKEHPLIKGLVKRVLGINDQAQSYEQTLKVTNTSLELDDQMYDQKTDLTTFLLPPGRYHYTDEAKLNAITILINSDHETARKGMEKLGQMDLHNALETLMAWDSASDEQVFQTVSEHINMHHPEYRIYCAWLLRNRYGKQSGNWLIRLLTDNDTRVHEYTFKILSKKMIDIGFIEEILKTMKEEKNIKPWHMKHFLRLLGARERFDSRLILDIYAKEVVDVLEKFSHSLRQFIRLEAYRAILKYKEYINLEEIKKMLSEDEDREIQHLAQR